MVLASIIMPKGDSYHVLHKLYPSPLTHSCYMQNVVEIRSMYLEKKLQISIGHLSNSSDLNMLHVTFTSQTTKQDRWENINHYLACYSNC